MLIPFLSPLLIGLILHPQALGYPPPSLSNFVANLVKSNISKEKFTDEEIFEVAINAGAQDCESLSDMHEIVSKKEDFYKVKNNIENKLMVNYC